MPHIVIHLSGEPDAGLAREAVTAVGELTQRVLGKKPEVIATTVQFIPAALWFVGGRSLAEQQRSAFHLDISITDETNTKAEKARYLQRMHAALSDLLGDAHDTSYIHIIDARAAAYGYGGLSQEQRYQAARQRAEG